MTSEFLQISEREIRTNGPGGIFGVCWRQWRAERRLAKRGIRFRRTKPSDVESAYSAMGADEFRHINGRQEWANWRTIPRCLNGLTPNQPLTVLDIGSGDGGSTLVLAWYAPLGSQIVGYELAEPLVRVASARTYRHATGAQAKVQFLCQNITEPLRSPEGTPWPDDEIDLVSSSGVVGHHFNREAFAELANELRRILKPSGCAMLDVGPALSKADLIESLSPLGFEPIRRCRSHLLDPTGQMVFRLEK